MYKSPRERRQLHAKAVATQEAQANLNRQERSQAYEAKLTEVGDALTTIFERQRSIGQLRPVEVIKPLGKLTYWILMKTDPESITRDYANALEYAHRIQRVTECALISNVVIHPEQVCKVTGVTDSPMRKTPVLYSGEEKLLYVAAEPSPYMDGYGSPVRSIMTPEELVNASMRRSGITSGFDIEPILATARSYRPTH